MRILRASLASAGIFFILVSAGCTGGMVSKAVDTAADQTVQAPPFTLKNLAGGSADLYSLLKQNKAVLINFWATWCPPCIEEIPDLISLQERHSGDGFVILGVDVGESPARVESFVKKMGINYPVLLDSDQSVAETYGVVGIPTSYLVNSEGQIIGQYHAYTAKLAADVEKALA